MKRPNSNLHTYISGPMSGYPDNNYPAFDWMETLLAKEGFDWIENPVKHFGGEQDREWCEYLARDITVLLNNNIEQMIYLPGWFTSKGAFIEYLIGSCLKLPMFNDEFLEIHPENDIVREAWDLVTGDRARAYGPPREDFLRVAKMMYNEDICSYSPYNFNLPYIMIYVKLSRHQHCPKRDNLVDICGYTLCLRSINENKSLEQLKEEYYGTTTQS